MPRTVFLVRHGETEWNVAGRRQGRLDSPLTERGHTQARRCAEVLSGRGVDALFASPIGRAKLTAATIAERIGVPVRTLDDLAELDHGRVAGLTGAELAARFPQLSAARDADRYRARFPGGESYADADVRAARALRVIAATALPVVAVVSHGMFGRMLFRQLTHLSPQRALGLSLPNDVIFRVDAPTGAVTELR